MYETTAVDKTTIAIYSHREIAIKIINMLREFNMPYRVYGDTIE